MLDELRQEAHAKMHRQQKHQQARRSVQSTARLPRMESDTRHAEQSTRTSKSKEEKAKEKT
tara:strand:- start:86 stop:268 length:183 start_codon:yes stop_codon:yes gene_type:complete